MILELRDISCGYDKGQEVIKHITFTMKTGEICCLLGPNGVGKTTLFKAVLGLKKLSGGKVLIDGKDINTWSSKKLAKTIAYVAQAHVPPFPYKVKEVILMGRTSHMEFFSQPSPLDYEIVNSSMGELGIEHLRNKEYTSISGGERQIVMLARAMVQKPSFLVLDEPTANLDFANSNRVMEQIIRLKEKGIGVIMTTHSPEQAFFCDSKVALLFKNKTMVYGDAACVITKDNMQSAYGVNVNIMEFLDHNGKIMRFCLPA